MIELTDEMRDALASALTDRMPVIMTYVDAEGQPHLSFRGTAQVFSKDQLGVWARNPAGGLPGAMAAGTNPKVALLYRNTETRVAWQFLGRGHVVTDEAARNQIFDSSPEFERNQDPERKGIAIVIDVDRVVMRGEVIMER
ncbi:MAG: pyridoxamine 5'-phosphate oxidase family protein [Chloroflexi bacterium]|nr:pyridoxamine 5'-phosphate oxidase family protein [Chloroflexota bacterium]MQC27608.1 pyridoxamine 5'-phosphate oxidase family protein [Chloroflexota bacterium]